MKQRFKRTVSWNKYKSDITAQPKSNNLDFIIDAKFRNINRLFVLSLKKDASSSTRNFNSLYYMPLVEIKDSNMLIDKNDFLIKHMKNVLKCQEMMTIQEEIY